MFPRAVLGVLNQGRAGGLNDQAWDDHIAELHAPEQGHPIHLLRLPEGGVEEGMRVCGRRGSIRIVARRRAGTR